MKLSDKELEELVYAVLRRCPHSIDDEIVAKKIVSAIIWAEVVDLGELGPDVFLGKSEKFR